LPEEALAAQAEVWNGTGRRPHAIITGSNTGIGKAAGASTIDQLRAPRAGGESALDGTVEE
jgi:hypothetical protein